MLYISLTYKALHDNTPSSLQELIVTYYPVTEADPLATKLVSWEADTLLSFKVILKPLSFL